RSIMTLFEGTFESEKTIEFLRAQEMIGSETTIAGVTAYELLEEGQPQGFGAFLRPDLAALGSTRAAFEKVATRASSKAGPSVVENAALSSLTDSFSASDAIWIAIDLPGEVTEFLAAQATEDPTTQALLAGVEIEAFPKVDGLLIAMGLNESESFKLRVSILGATEKDGEGVRKLLELGRMQLGLLLPPEIVKSMKIEPLTGGRAELSVTVTMEEFAGLAQGLMQMV